MPTVADPHPEHCAGTTDEDRRGDTTDVAVADRGGQSRRQCLERRDRLRCRFVLRERPGKHQPEGDGEAADLHEARRDGQDASHHDQHQRHERPVPDGRLN